MPITLETPPVAVLRNVSWDAYLRLSEDISSGTRLSYYKGTLEMMSPISVRHDGGKSLLARLLESFCDRRGIPLDGTGSLTLRIGAREVGIEPDESFYLGTTPPPDDAGIVDLSVYPPPDLAIEVEVSRSALDKELIYRELGVAEVWRWDGHALRIRTLRADRSGYDDAPTSPLVPSLPVEVLVAHMRMSKSMRQGEVVRSWMTATK